MHLITRSYLTDIIFKKISLTIDKYREGRQHQFDNEPYPGATDEEVLDFIISIPFFDVRLKDFLLGNLTEITIITSRSWEKKFTKNVKLWSKSFEWLYGGNHFLHQISSKDVKCDKFFLTLPY